MWKEKRKETVDVNYYYLRDEGVSGAFIEDGASTLVKSLFEMWPPFFNCGKGTTFMIGIGIRSRNAANASNGVFVLIKENEGRRLWSKRRRDWFRFLKGIRENQHRIEAATCIRWTLNFFPNKTFFLQVDWWLEGPEEIKWLRMWEDWCSENELDMGFFICCSSDPQNLVHNMVQMLFNWNSKSFFLHANWTNAVPCSYHSEDL